METGKACHRAGREVAASPLPLDSHVAAAARAPTSLSWKGAVTAFDGLSGLGVVEAASGERFAFHCTSLVDGSRHIDAGRRVAFRLRPGHLGRLEAVNLGTVDEVAREVPVGRLGRRE